MANRYPSPVAVAHLHNIAKLAGLEIVQVRPEVDHTDAEVWCVVPQEPGQNQKLCGLLARRNRSGGTVYGTTGSAAEQKAMADFLKSKKHARPHMLGDSLLDALCDGPL